MSESEDEVADALARLRGHEELWDEYRRAMTVQTARYEEAAAGLGMGNYFVEKGLAARREVDSYVGRLAYQQAEYAEEVVREINAAVEAASERPARQEAGA